ncbi:MAG: GH13_23 / GH13_17 / GH13_31 / GH13_40 / GH13_ 35 / GH13_30 / GH13_16 / GH13_29 / GH13 / GH13_36 / G H13_20 / GH13_4 / GH13_2 / GH13_34 / GH13_1 / GH13 _21 / GH13_19, partial [uncultured Gemmatimonadetes bacterium]
DGSRGGGAGGGRGAVVATRGDLPDLPALVPGQQRRRGGRPAGDPAAAGLPAVAGCGRGVDQPVLSLAHARLRLRRHRPRGGRQGVRQHRGLRRGGPRGARPGDPGDPGLHPQPHLQPPPLVPGIAALARGAAPRLVHLARPGARRRPAQQLAQRVRRQRVGVGFAHAAVLPAHLSARAAGPQLAQPGRGAGDAPRRALLAGPRRRRPAGGRRAEGDEGPPLPRRSAQSRVRRRFRRPVRCAAARALVGPAGDPRRDRADARRGGWVRRRPGDDRRDLQRGGADRFLLRPRRAGGALSLQLPAHQAAVGRAGDRCGHPALRVAASRGRLAQLGAGQPRPRPRGHPRGPGTGARGRNAAADAAGHADPLLRRRAGDAERRHPARARAGPVGKEPPRARPGARPRPHAHAVGRLAQRGLFRRRAVASPHPRLLAGERACAGARPRVHADPSPRAPGAAPARARAVRRRLGTGGGGGKRARFYPLRGRHTFSGRVEPGLRAGVAAHWGIGDRGARDAAGEPGAAGRPHSPPARRRRVDRAAGV